MQVITLVGLIAACTHSAAQPPLPAPCVNNDSVYTYSPALAARSFVPPRAKHVILPPPDFHGTAVIRILVDTRGHVVPESTHVDGTSRDEVVPLKRTSRNYVFWPATIGTCAVAAWYRITLEHE
jgi:hypothetical protein